MTNIGTFGNISPVPGTTQNSPFNTTYTVAPSIGDTGVQIMTIVYANVQNLSGFCTVDRSRRPRAPSSVTRARSGIGGCQGQRLQVLPRRRRAVQRRRQPAEPRSAT
jgi:hypothetical protein